MQKANVYNVDLGLLKDFYVDLVCHNYQARKRYRRWKITLKGFLLPELIKIILEYDLWGAWKKLKKDLVRQLSLKVGDLVCPNAGESLDADCDNWCYGLIFNGKILIEYCDASRDPRHNLSEFSLGKYPFGYFLPHIRTVWFDPTPYREELLRTLH